MGAVDGLDAGLFVDADHHRPLWRVEVQPDNVVDLFDEVGSVEILNVSTRCGLRPKARHILEIVVCERRLTWAIDRVDQWVEPSVGTPPTSW